MTKFRKTLLATTAAAILFAATPQGVQASIKMEDVTQFAETNFSKKGGASAYNFSAGKDQEIFAQDLAKYFKTNVFDPGFASFANKFATDNEKAIKAGSLEEKSSEFQEALKQIQKSYTLDAKEDDNDPFDVKSLYLFSFGKIKKQDLRKFLGKSLPVTDIMNETRDKDDFLNQSGYQRFNTLLAKSFIDSQTQAEAQLRSLLPSGFKLEDKAVKTFVLTYADSAKLDDAKFDALSTADKMKAYTDTLTYVQRTLQTLSDDAQASSLSLDGIATAFGITFDATDDINARIGKVESALRQQNTLREENLNTLLAAAKAVGKKDEDLQVDSSDPSQGLKAPAAILILIQDAITQTADDAKAVLDAATLATQQAKTKAEDNLNALVAAAGKVGITEEKLHENDDKTHQFRSLADIVQLFEDEINKLNNTNTTAVNKEKTALSDAQKEHLKAVNDLAKDLKADVSKIDIKKADQVLGAIKTHVEDQAKTLEATQKALIDAATAQGAKDADIYSNVATKAPKPFAEIATWTANKITETMTTKAIAAARALKVKKAAVNGQDLDTVLTAIKAKVAADEAALVAQYQTLANGINAAKDIDLKKIEQINTEKDNGKGGKVNLTSAELVTEITDKLTAKLKAYKVSEDSQMTALRTLAAHFVATGTDLSTKDFTDLNTIVTNGIAGLSTQITTLTKDVSDRDNTITGLNTAAATTKTALDGIAGTLLIKDPATQDTTALLTATNANAGKLIQNWKDRQATIDKQKTTINTYSAAIKQMNIEVGVADTADFAAFQAQVANLKAAATTHGGGVGSPVGGPAAAVVDLKTQEVKDARARSKTKGNAAGQTAGAATQLATDAAIFGWDNTKGDAATFMKGFKTQADTNATAVTTLTGERDAALADATKFQTQRDEANEKARKANFSLLAAQGNLTNVTTAKDGEIGTLKGQIAAKDKEIAEKTTRIQSANTALSIDANADEAAFTAAVAALKASKAPTSLATDEEAIKTTALTALKDEAAEAKKQLAAQKATFDEEKKKLQEDAAAKLAATTRAEKELKEKDDLLKEIFKALAGSNKDTILNEINTLLGRSAHDTEAALKATQKKQDVEKKLTEKKNKMKALKQQLTDLKGAAPATTTPSTSGGGAGGGAASTTTTTSTSSDPTPTTKTFAGVSWDKVKIIQPPLRVGGELVTNDANSPLLKFAKATYDVSKGQDLTKLNPTKDLEKSLFNRGIDKGFVTLTKEGQKAGKTTETHVTGQEFMLMFYTDLQDGNYRTLEDAQKFIGKKEPKKNTTSGSGSSSSGSSSAEPKRTTKSLLQTYNVKGVTQTKEKNHTTHLEFSLGAANYRVSKKGEICKFAANKWNNVTANLAIKGQVMSLLGTELAAKYGVK